MVQRQVLYLGEINDYAIVDQHRWRFFPMIAKRRNCTCETVRIHVKDLDRPRQWGACWLALTLWDRLELELRVAWRINP